MKPKRKGPEYRRDPKTDPHLPHTTRFRRQDDLHFPAAALLVMQRGWDEMVRTFQQYDEHAGMLMLYRMVRDATKAAGFPDSMAYLVRNYIIGKLNDQKIKYMGSGGEMKTFNIKEHPYESKAEQIVNKLLEADWHSDSEKHALQKRGAKTRITQRATRPRRVTTKAYGQHPAVGKSKPYKP